MIKYKSTERVRIMKLPSYVRKALEKLESKGYEAYVVGGAVRDSLLNKKPNDYDVSTNALPEEVKEVFAGYPVFDTGIKHGTVSVIIGRDKRKPLEITTYRCEADYEDFRHPKTVMFVRDLETDLKRRDFTINALAYNKEIIDNVGGIDDLKTGIIRAIGNPTERFTEDPLRILRALRFAAELGFEIESGTAAAARAHAGLIAKVSAERINAEFSKLLSFPGAATVIREFFPIIRVFIPEYEGVDPEPALLALDNLEAFPLRLAAFFIPIAPKADAVLRRLKYSLAQIRKTTFLVEHFTMPIRAREEELVALLLKHDCADLLDLLTLQAAFDPSTDDPKMREELKRLWESRCFRLRDLKIGGRDLLALGFPEGMRVRQTLERLLGEVARGILPNHREELVRRAGEIKKEDEDGLSTKTSI